MHIAANLDYRIEFQYFLINGNFIGHKSRTSLLLEKYGGIFVFQNLCPNVKLFAVYILC